MPHPAKNFKVAPTYILRENCSKSRLWLNAKMQFPHIFYFPAPSSFWQTAPRMIGRICNVSILPRKELHTYFQHMNDYNSPVTMLHVFLLLVLSS